MSNPLDSLTPAAGAEALPLELLQPLDSNNPASMSRVNQVDGWRQSG